MARSRFLAIPMIAALALMPAAASASGGAADQPSVGEGLPLTGLPDVAAPLIDDPISDAELEDLKAVASQKGMSLQAAIDRYAWNDNFALAVSTVREASPETFTGAEIVDGGTAWLAFSAGATEAALDTIDTFTSSQRSVTVEVRPDVGFTEVELEKAIATAHYAVFDAANVRDASTSFDFETRQITTVVALDSDVADSVLDDLRAGATKSLIDSGLGRVLDSIAVLVVRSNLPELGGTDSNTEHMGGERLAGHDCTSGFVVRTPAGVRGVSTAGHCNNALTDDGVALNFQAAHFGAQGDFQWHTGPQARPDDFYAGDANVTEVNRRDVAGVGGPVVGQALCKNGISTHRTCDDVIQLNVCNGAACSLVQMSARLAAGGDSGGPVYWNFTAYGLHQGWRYDPVWPFDRDLFSRANRLPNALNVSVALN